MLHDHQPLLERIQGFDIVARRALGCEDPPFNAVQFVFQFIENRKVAIDHRVDDGVQDEARTLAQQFWFALAAGAYLGEPLLRPAAHGEHVIGAHEDGKLANVILVAGRFDQMQHREQRVAVFLDLGPLVTDQRVLDGQGVQVKRFLHVREFGRGGILQRHPNKAVRPMQILRDLPDRDLGEFRTVLVRGAADEHARSLLLGQAPSLRQRGQARGCDHVARR